MKKKLRSTEKCGAYDTVEEEWIEKRCRMMLEDCLAEGLAHGLSGDSSKGAIAIFVKRFMYNHNLSREMPNE